MVLSLEKRLKTITSEDLCDCIVKSIISPKDKDDTFVSMLLEISEEPCYDERLLFYLELMRERIWCCVDTSAYPGGKYKDYWADGLLKTMSHFGYITIWNFTEEEYTKIYDALGY